MYRNLANQHRDIWSRPTFAIPSASTNHTEINKIKEELNELRSKFEFMVKLVNYLIAQNRNKLEDMDWED